MNKKHQFNFSYTLALLIVCGLYTGSLAAADSMEPVIAGTQPDKRPIKAPIIQNYKKPESWYTQALTGLQPPYPSNFNFLEAQQAWYTPFTQPGMTRPYDIRGWHQY